MPTPILQAYNKAQEAVSLRQPYEQALAAGQPAGAQLLAAYVSYIKLEEAQGEPARVQVSGAGGGGLWVMVCRSVGGEALSHDIQVDVRGGRESWCQGGCVGRCEGGCGAGVGGDGG